MSRSTDAEYYFQTSASIDNSARKAKKSKNSKGDPIRRPSKILAVTDDSETSAEDRAIFIAIATGCVERISLQNGQVTHTFRPKTSTPAPLTCLALSARQRTASGSWTRTLVAGSWDKSIYSWTLAYSATGIERSSESHRFTGHTDFVKAVLTASLDSSNPFLISASADTTIRVWSLASGALLHTLQGHARGVQALALDPSSSDSTLTVFSGDSSREIRAWTLGASAATEVPLAAGEAVPPFAPLLRHDTGVFALAFDANADLWTASADHAAKCLARERAWAADTVLLHPDYVRAVALDEERGWVVTGCRDEDVRVWDVASGELACVFDGHFEDVTGLVVVGSCVVSVSIDGTVRRWSLKREDVKKAREESEKGGQAEEEEAAPKTSMLTEEEERELAELMDDSD